MVDSNEHSAPRFTVIMPLYNHSAYIDQAIESVRNQTLGDWRLIVVDDESSDDSHDRALRHAADDERITVLRQSNAGPAAARNRAAAAATGEWMTYLDSDDMWYSHTLEAYADAIAANPNREFFYGRRDRISADGRIEKTAGEFQSGPTGARELLGRMYLSTMVVCHTRRLFEAVGGFDASLRSCEDYDLFLRMSMHTSFMPIGKSTGLRRRHGSNLSRQSGFSRFQEAGVISRFLSSGGSSLVPAWLAQRRLAKLYYSSARQYFKERSMSKACESISHSLRHRFTLKALGLGLLCRVLA
ncbi:MAG: glycosyltransferase [Planctomycetes bacterium]|nr:glycosyltransferase [Planctomycetota bacterium]